LLSSSCVLCMMLFYTYCALLFLCVCLRLVSCVWWCPTHIVLCFCVFIFVLCLVYDGVQHILCSVVFVCLSSSCVLCMMVFNTYCALLILCVCLRLVSCVWWCPTHIVLCFCVFIFVLCLVYDGVQHILCCVFVCLSSSSVLCMMMSNTYCALLFWVFLCLRPVYCVPNGASPFLNAPSVSLTFTRLWILH
jgi:hypothetical protein